MQEGNLLLIPIFLPVLAGIVLLAAGKRYSGRWICIFTAAVLLVSGGFAVNLIVNHVGAEYLFFNLTGMLPVYFRLDTAGQIFAGCATLLWLPGGLFSFAYMREERRKPCYYAFYMMVYGVLMALSFSGNMITFYIFYEMMTLLSLPLVMHSGTREAIMAGLKYLFYSLAGAYMVLFGLYFLYRYANTLTFTAGGTLNPEMMAGNEGILLTAAFLMILGFCVKAGMFPMHAWLWAAHPVAPAPASAVLSGIIVKMGVLGVIRGVFFLFGAEFIRGSWVQSVWITLALLTVFIGSMLAYREKQLKKRLAYSTVSQVSYILFGLALLNPAGFTGAILHVVFHALIKCGLFLTAGAVIYRTGRQNVDQLTGIGKEMPITLWCFTFLSLALIGIPPAAGFISKWYLASGALNSGPGILAYSGPVTLLVSALLTAGYLLPITVKGFFPGEGYDYKALQKKEAPCIMWIPVMILTVLAFVAGIWPNALIRVITGIVDQVM